MSDLEQPALIERLSAAVHADWVEEQHRRGRTSSIGRDGEEYMVPYDQLSEAAKELGRVTVRAVLKHLPTAAHLLDPYDWGPGGVPEGRPFNLADYPTPREHEGT